MKYAIFLLLLPVPLQAKITADANGGTASASLTTSISFTQNASGCADGMILIMAGGGIEIALDPPQAPDLNASMDAETAVGIWSFNDGTQSVTKIWGVKNATAGVRGITITSDQNTDMDATSISLCGVNPSALNFGVASTTGSTTVGYDPFTTINVLSSGSWIVDAQFEFGSTLVLPLPTSNRNHLAVIKSQTKFHGFLSQYRGPVGAGNYIMPWFYNAPGSAGFTWNGSAVGVAPSTGTAVVQTSSVSAVTQTSAQISCAILFDGGSSVNPEGVCISTNPNPTHPFDNCTSATGTPYTVTVTGLLPGTLYYPRCFAKNSTGTDYGDQIPFGTTGTPGVYARKGSGSVITGKGTGSIIIRR